MAHNANLPGGYYPWPLPAPMMPGGYYPSYSTPQPPMMQPSLYASPPEFAQAGAVPMGPYHGHQQHPLLSLPTAPPKVSTVYVGDLNPSVTEAQVYELFKTCGPLVSVRVCRHAETQQSLGYGYVNFHSRGDALTAMENLNGAKLADRAIRVARKQRGPATWRLANSSRTNNAQLPSEGVEGSNENSVPEHKTRNANAATGVASVLVKKKVPRPIYTRQGVAAVELAMLLPLAVNMTKAWLQRCQRGVGGMKQLPRTVPKLERAIRSFCMVRVQLDTDALLKTMVAEKMVKPAPYTIRSSAMSAAPGGSVPVVRGGSRGGARGCGAAPVRGRGGGAANNANNKSTTKVAKNVPGMHLRPSGPCPPPTRGPLLLGDIENMEVLAKKLRYFVYKMSTVKLRHQRDIFLRQLQDVGTAVGHVDPQLVVQALIKDRSVCVSHSSREGEPVIASYVGERASVSR